MTDDYFDLTRMIGRFHRRLLDVVRIELDRIGVKDINPVQALLLCSIEGEEVMFRDLVNRNYYLGSNAYYNIKKLVEYGYMDQKRAPHDRRAMRLCLSEKGKDVCAKLHEIEKATAEALDARGENGIDLGNACRTLRLLERGWSDLIQHGHF